MIFPADHVWQDSFARLNESNKVTKLVPRNRVFGSYRSENSTLSSVESFDLAVDPDVLLAEPLSKVAGTAPSPAADENPTSAD
jgi:hypothetical protein